jgi:flagellar motility protein MotE (MotC chaperone)
MAEALDREEENTAAPEAEPTPAPPKKKAGNKKKKGKGCGFFIMLAILAIGAAVGVQASGSMDLRPYVYPVIPNLPLVGSDLQEALAIPDVYSLTTEERRRIENEEWDRRITADVRSLDEYKRSIEKASKDLTVKEQDLDYEREELAKKLEDLSSEISADQEAAALTPSQQSDIKEIVSTFNQMSVRNAAGIIEKLNPNLAVAILDGLPEDTRANILGRMEAEKAAGLTERLTTLYKSRNKDKGGGK